jgi:integrase
MSSHLAPITQTLDPISLIERTQKLSPSTKVKYIRALTDYLKTGSGIGDAQALTCYAEGLSKSGRAFLKAAITLWADSMITHIKSQATPENVNAVQANIHRLEAMKQTIQVKPHRGNKAHTWLSPAQVQAMYAGINDDIVGNRDRAAIGLLVAAGLRREEAISITFDAIKLQPIGQRIRTVLQVTGKGAKDRVVPISDHFAGHLDKWGHYVNYIGFICRRLEPDGSPGDSLSAIGLFKLVRRYGKLMGIDDLAPHDLRRTFAQIGYESGIPITQVSVLLGHASVTTTQRYLNLELDLETTASDFIPWGN